MVFSVAGCGTDENKTKDPYLRSDSMTLEEAAIFTGMSIEAPVEFNSYKRTYIYGDSDQKYLLLTYEDTASSNVINLRKTTLDQKHVINFSRDDFKQVNTYERDGITIETKGENDMYYLVSWGRDAYAYTITSMRPLDPDVATELFDEVDNTLGPPREGTGEYDESLFATITD